jgi:hypothetical protein
MSHTFCSHSISAYLLLIDVHWMYLDCDKQQWQDLCGRGEELRSWYIRGRRGGGFLDQSSDYQALWKGIILPSLFLFTFPFRFAVFAFLFLCCFPPQFLCSFFVPSFFSVIFVSVIVICPGFLQYKQRAIPCLMEDAPHFRMWDRS